MRFDAFIGGSYQSQAMTADCERTINWFPEMLESPGATSRAVLYPTPGVRRLSQVTRSGIGRAHFAQSGREFGVIGNTFYEIDSVGIPTARGTMTLNANPATISSNGDTGDQLFITSGRNGYIFSLTSNLLTRITALNGRADFGAFLDGYFLSLDATTATLYVSALADGATWQTGLQFAQRSLAPDRWVSMSVSSRFIWLLGEHTSEVWYDTGQQFPLAPHPSGLVGWGCAAPYSVSALGDGLIWLAQTAGGRRCVVKTQGFTPQVISTKPIETLLASYRSVTTAVSDVYSEAGHSFYLLHFDQADQTWCWDESTGLWHERGTWIPDEGKFVSWRPRHYAFAFGQHRMLDAGGGSIYELANTYTMDVDDRLIRRMRRAPAISNENKRVFYSSFELDLEPGVGIVGGKAEFEMSAVPDTADVTGTVTYDTVNLWAGATVTATLDGSPYDTATTNGSGVYTFTDVPAGSFEVVCEGNPGPGYRYGTNSGTHTPPADTTLDIDCVGA